MSKLSKQKDIVKLNLKVLDFWTTQFDEEYDLEEEILPELLKAADIFLSDIKRYQELANEKE